MEIAHNLDVQTLSNSLTAKQRKYCRLYIEDFKGTKAAIEAGYSKRTAAVISSNLLKQVKIQQYIEYLQRDLAKQAGVSKLMIVRQLKKYVFNDIGTMYNTWINLKDFQELPEDARQCIQEIETKTTKTGQQVRIKSVDKLKSTEMLIKLLGFNEPTKIDYTTNGKDLNKEGIKVVIVNPGQGKTKEDTINIDPEPKEIGP